MWMANFPATVHSFPSAAGRNATWHGKPTCQRHISESFIVSFFSLPPQHSQPILGLKATSTLSYTHLPTDVKGTPPHLGRSVPGATHNDAPFAIHTIHLLFMSRVLDSEGAVSLMNANLSISRREMNPPQARANYFLCRERQTYRSNPSLQWYPNLPSFR